MKNILKNLKMLARLLALTLLLGVTAPAQAIPVVIVAASLFVGGTAGFYGFIESAKWAIGYEDPNAPKDQSESDVQGTQPPASNSIDSSQNTVSGSPDGGSTNGSGQTIKTNTAPSSTSQSTASNTPSFSSGGSAGNSQSVSEGKSTDSSQTSTIVSSTFVQSPTTTTTTASATPTAPISDTDKDTDSTLVPSSTPGSESIPTIDSTATIIQSTSGTTSTQGAIPTQTPLNEKNEKKDEKKAPLGMEYKSSAEYAHIREGLSPTEKTAMDQDITNRMTEERQRIEDINAQLEQEQDSIKNAQPGANQAQADHDEAVKYQEKSKFHKLMQSFLKPGTSPLSKEDESKRQNLKQNSVVSDSENKDADSIDAPKVDQAPEPRTPASIDSYNLGQQMGDQPASYRDGLLKEQGYAGFEPQKDEITPGMEYKSSAEYAHIREGLSPTEKTAMDQDITNRMTEERQRIEDINAQLEQEQDSIKNAQPGANQAQADHDEAVKYQEKSKFHKLMQSFLKPGTSPLSKEDESKRQNLKQNSVVSDSENKDADSIDAPKVDQAPEPRTPASIDSYNLGQQMGDQPASYRDGLLKEQGYAGFEPQKDEIIPVKPVKKAAKQRVDQNEPKADRSPETQASEPRTPASIDSYNLGQQMGDQPASYRDGLLKEQGYAGFEPQKDEITPGMEYKSSAEYAHIREGLSPTEKTAMDQDITNRMTEERQRIEDINAQLEQEQDSIKNAQPGANQAQADHDEAVKYQEKSKFHKLMQSFLKPGTSPLSKEDESKRQNLKQNSVVSDSENKDADSIDAPKVDQAPEPRTPASIDSYNLGQQMGDQPASYRDGLLKEQGYAGFEPQKDEIIPVKPVKKAAKQRVDQNEPKADRSPETQASEPRTPASIDSYNLGQQMGDQPASYRDGLLKEQGYAGFEPQKDEITPGMEYKSSAEYAHIREGLSPTEKTAMDQDITNRMTEERQRIEDINAQLEQEQDSIKNAQPGANQAQADHDEAVKYQEKSKFHKLMQSFLKPGTSPLSKEDESKRQNLKQNSVVSDSENKDADSIDAPKVDQAPEPRTPASIDSYNLGQQMGDQPASYRDGLLKEQGYAGFEPQKDEIIPVKPVKKAAKQRVDQNEPKADRSPETQASEPRTPASIDSYNLGQQMGDQPASYRDGLLKEQGYAGFEPQKDEITPGMEYKSSAEYAHIREGLSPTEKTAMDQDITNRMTEERQRIEDINAQLEQEQDSIKNAQPGANQAQADHDEAVKYQEKSKFHKLMQSFLKPGTSPLSKEDESKRQNLKQNSVVSDSENKDADSIDAPKVDQAPEPRTPASIDSYNLGQQMGDQPASYRDGLLKEQGYAGFEPQKDEIIPVKRVKKAAKQRVDQNEPKVDRSPETQASEPRTPASIDSYNLGQQMGDQPASYRDGLLKEQGYAGFESQKDEITPVKRVKKAAKQRVDQNEPKVDRSPETQASEPRTEPRTPASIDSYNLGQQMGDQPASYRDGLLKEQGYAGFEPQKDEIAPAKRDRQVAQPLVNDSDKKAEQAWKKRRQFEQSFKDELNQHVSNGEKRRKETADKLSKAKSDAKDKANEDFFTKMKNKLKQPQTPVANIPEEEEVKEEEPETPPLDETNEEFISRTEEFEDELNDEDEKDKGDDKAKPKSRKPDTVPKLNASAEAHLQGARALAHGSALMTMETMSGFRNAMGLYRSGRAFSFGTASLDDVSNQELLASTDPVNQVPTFNREIGSWHNFVQVHGLKANRDHVAGLPGGSISGQGMTAGVFYQLNAEMVTGMLLSAHKNSYSFNDGLGSGSLENVRIGPFMSWTRGDFHLDASLTLAHNNYSLKRSDSAGKALKASFSGHEIAAYTGVGYDIHMDSWLQGLTFTPMAELLYVRSQNAGYTEDGQSSEAMSVSGSTASQLITRYGLETSYLFPNLESPTELKARLGRQRHNMASQNSGYSLQGGGSGSLSIPAFAEDATFVGLGFYRKVSDYSHISLNYNGTKSKNGLSHGIQFNFESKF